MKNQPAQIDKDQAFNEPTDIYNRIANWTLAQFEGQAIKLTAPDQRKLLGGYFGKGRLTVENHNGQWLVYNWVSASFGTDVTYNGVYNLETLKKLY